MFPSPPFPARLSWPTDMILIFVDPLLVLPLSASSPVLPEREEERCYNQKKLDPVSGSGQEPGIWSNLPASPRPASFS